MDEIFLIEDLQLARYLNMNKPDVALCYSFLPLFHPTLIKKWHVSVFMLTLVFIFYTT